MTLSLVNVWHSPLDEVFECPIFSGLLVKHLERLKRCGAVTGAGDWSRLLQEHGQEFGLAEGFTWGDGVPGYDLYLPDRDLKSEKIEKKWFV